MRIQNGTSNILLDNIASEDDVADDAPTVVYTRRPRFVDEELDETKDIIVTTSQPHRPAVAAAVAVVAAEAVVVDLGAPPAAINNRTDYEQCRETGATGDGALRKDLLSGSSMSISTATADRSPQLEPVVLCTAQQQQQSQPLVQHVHHEQQQQPHHPHNNHQQRPLTTSVDATTLSSRCAAVPVLKSPAAIIQSSSPHAPPQSIVAAEPDVEESANLRREQLSRVAEWVQSNHLGECVAGTTAVCRKVVGADAGPMPIHGETTTTTSIDSGYKTKGPTHYSQRTATTANNINNNHHHITIYGTNGATESRTESVCNNNLTATRGQRSAGDGCPQATAEMAAGTTAQLAPETPIDFAQMEYNVKQFLLKQNEWSTTTTTTAQPQNQHPQAVNGQTAATAHRTETNL